MTTAYSTLLGLALPVTGELSGTWGDTVNNYITNYLDSAVAGTQTLSSDADVTLTKTTGTTLGATSSQYAILLCSGARTAARIITAPAASKFYIVINSTSGGYAVTLRGAGPTTGISISAGEYAVCAWNGSDFVKVSGLGGTGTFTNLTVSGSLTLSGGTANGVLYLNGSKVATSGSALVFDGTDMGVGGAVESGIKLKLYGAMKVQSAQPIYFMNSDNTNNVQINNAGATGASNGQMAFTLGGVGEGMRLTSTGLGIGTSSPATRLQVGDATVAATNKITLGKTTATTESNLPTVYAGSIINAAVGNDAVIEASSTSGGVVLRTASTTRMVVDQTGNLGIGTTSPAYKVQAAGEINATTNLSAANNIYSTAGTTGKGFFFTDGTAPGSNHRFALIRYDTVGAGAALLSAYGPIAFEVGATSGAVNSGTIAARFDTSGNLGLGVTPSAWSGGFKAAQIVSSAIAGYDSGAGNIQTEINTNAYQSSLGAYAYIKSYAALQYRQILGTGHAWYNAPSGTAGTAITFTQAMTLDASGRLGVGQTSPGYPVDVTKTGTQIGGTAGYLIGNFRDGTPNKGVSLGYDSGSQTGIVVAQSNAASSNLAFWTYEAGVSGWAERARIDSSGNFGLGVTPSGIYKLQVNGVAYSLGTQINDQSAAAFGSWTSIQENGFYDAGGNFLHNAIKTSGANDTWNYRNTGYATRYKQLNSVHYWYTAPSGTAGTAITFTQAMTLDASGRLLVGYTTSQASGYSLQVNTDAYIYGLVVGRGAGAVSTNTAVGAGALNVNSTGARNTAVGYVAGNSLTTSNYCTFIGSYAGYSTTGGSNTAVGDTALQNVTTGTNNVAIGNATINGASGSGSYNVAVGVLAMTSNTTASYNTALGYGALSSNTTATNNTAVGYAAMTAHTETANGGNTALGYQALKTGTTGSYNNTAIGTNAMAGATVSGYTNVAVGQGAMYGATSGSSNTAVGVGALYSNTTGGPNTAIGYQALNANISTANNTAVGFQAGVVATGANNQLFGHQAGYALTTGTGNFFAGYGAGGAITTGSKNTIIGNYNGNQGSLDIRTASNYIVLSDGDGNPRGIFDNSGNFLVGATSTGYTSSLSSYYTPVAGYWINNHSTGTASGVRYVGFGYGINEIGSITQSGTTAVLYNTTSDQRLKENIADAASASDLIDAIKVRQFDWKSDGSHQRFGFVAQELVEVAPEAVHVPIESEDMMAVDYSKLVPMLIKEVQSLRTRVAQLEKGN